MKKFTPQALEPYLRKKVFPILNLKNPKVQQIERANGGLSSTVFKVKINNISVFVKQVADDQPNYFEEFPDDLAILFSRDRQMYEAKAIELFNEALGEGFAPAIVYFNPEDRVLVLNDVAGREGRLFADVFEDYANESITIQLAEIAAKLANKTYGKHKFLRSEKEDFKVRKVKLKYTYSNLFGGLCYNAEAKRKIKKFVDKSVNCAKSLCHGDYHPKNIIIKNNSQVAIIDFEEAVIHDPVWDIGALAAHYLLRVANHSQKADKIKKLSILLVNKFFENLDIPEQKADLERRMNNYIAGWMMLRVDGYSKSGWITDEKIKNAIRQNTRGLVIEDLSLAQFVDSF